MKRLWFQETLGLVLPDTWWEVLPKSGEGLQAMATRCAARALDQLLQRRKTMAS